MHSGSLQLIHLLEEVVDIEVDQDVGSDLEASDQPHLSLERETRLQSENVQASAVDLTTFVA